MIGRLIENAYNRHRIFLIFRGRGQAPTGRSQRHLKENGKQSKPPLGGGGYEQKRKDFRARKKI